MSNYITWVKIKETGEIVRVKVIEDHFGPHRYGYFLAGGGFAYKEDEIEHIYEKDQPKENGMKELTKIDFDPGKPIFLPKSHIEGDIEAINLAINAVKTCNDLVDAVKELQEKVEELEMKHSLENEEWVSVDNVEVEKKKFKSPKGEETALCKQCLHPDQKGICTCGRNLSAKYDNKLKERTYTVSELRPKFREWFLDKKDIVDFITWLELEEHES